MTKVCPKCKLTLPISFFRRESKRKDGFQYQCKVCIEKYLVKYRKSSGWKEIHKRAEKKYEMKNPIKKDAHVLSKRHKSDLMKDACEACGSTMRLQMHHPDYSKPLHVRTLCYKCHQRQHYAII